LWDRSTKSKSSVAISVAIHVVAIAGLATITFQYPLKDIFDRREPTKAVPIRYIPLEPREVATESPSPRRQRPAAAPAALPQVAVIPNDVPPAGVPTAPAGGAAIGAGGSTAVVGRDPGVGFGIRPGIPDGRLATNPGFIPRAPETEGQKAERALAAIYEQYLDSARASMANPGRKPGDWSWGGKDGDKWGWDQNGIHIGGITIPNMVLAALPLNITSNVSPVDARARDYVTSDIRMHSGLMSHNEFRQAVQSVRERVDRERRERMQRDAARKKAPPCCS
jgi:hypothetical protein